MPSAHPHFTSPQTWHLRFEDGVAAAREAKRHLLVIVGRQSCGGSRSLIERTIAKEEIVDFLQEKFICVASDADALESQVQALLTQLPQQTPTPVCIYLSTDGRVVHSTAGGRPAAVFLNDMLRASSRS